MFLYSQYGAHFGCCRMRALPPAGCRRMQRKNLPDAREKSAPCRHAVLTLAPGASTQTPFLEIMSPWNFCPKER